MQNHAIVYDDIRISCIGHKEYLIEASVNEAKFICEIDDFDISSVLITDGPKITIGNDFRGIGTINHISVLRDNPKLPLLLRVILA